MIIGVLGVIFVDVMYFGVILSYSAVMGVFLDNF